MRPDNLSIDSDLYIGDLDHSPNLVKSHLSPSNLSRDSGLTLSDAQLYDEDGSIENLSERKNYNRSVSQYMERDSEKLKYTENTVSRSYDTAFENPKPPPRKNKKREYLMEKDIDKGARNHMTQSYSAENYQKLKRASCESLRSLEDMVDIERETQFLHVHNADFGTLTKSSSGAHLYFDENKESSNKHYVSECEIQTQRHGNSGKLTRQSSVTESNPPMSPQSRLSTGSSIDSGIPHSSSCSSFIPSHESQFSVWSACSNRIQESQDDASVGSHLSSAKRSNSSKKSANYLVSPPVSPKTSHKVFNSDSSKQNVSVRRSFPLDYSNASKGSGSDSFKEAEDIIRPRYQLTACEFHDQKDSEHYSPMLKYGSSASTNDIRQNMPMKAFTKYGLGTSPPPGVILRNHQKQHKREIAPMRASHDSAILSQVRRNSTDSGSSGSEQRNQDYHHSELHVPKLTTHPFPLVKSDSDGDINRTLSSSPSRPEKPPSYDEACQRTFMIKHGIPLEISEQDSQKQKEASLLAKQLYEESLRKYMEEHLNSPSVQNMERKDVPRKEEVIDEKEESEGETSDSSEEELIVCKKDPKKIYEESMKAYEQKSTNNVPDSKSSKDSHLLSPSSLHRSYSDSSDKAGMWAHRSPTREKSPLANDRLSTGANRNTAPNKQLNYSSSSVSNSSSDTVTENQQIPPYRRDRSDSSPVTGRHFFPKTSDSIAQSYSAQSRRSSNEQSRDASVESRYSIKSRDSSLSQDRSNSYSRDFERRDITPKPRYLGGARGSSAQQSNSATNKFESKNTIVWKSKRDSVPSASRDVTNSQNLSRDNTPKRDTELPWSVKNLRSVYDRSGQMSPSNSQATESRPPPPPYQPPPPFRRDNARMSSSSNSSCSSSNTENSANIPLTTSSVSHRRLGGPQARDSFSDDSDASSRSSGNVQISPNHSSDHESWTYVDTEVTFV